MAEDRDLTLGEPQEVADRVDQRGLAGPVRAEQAEEAAGRDLEVERVEREDAVVVALGELPQLEGGGHPPIIANWPIRLAMGRRSAAPG